MKLTQIELENAYTNYVIENTTDNAVLYGNFIKKVETDPEFAEQWIPARIFKMKELIQKLNDLKIIQRSYDFVEDLPADIAEKYFPANSIECELDIDKHRWYETSISVWETDLGLIGVRAITNLYSEMSMYYDMHHRLEFFEMEPIETITYKIK